VQSEREPWTWQKGGELSEENGQLEPPEIRCQSRSHLDIFRLAVCSASSIFSPLQCVHRRIYLDAITLIPLVAQPSMGSPMAESALGPNAAVPILSGAPVTPAFEPKQLVDRFEKSAGKQGFRTERYGMIGECPLIALTKRTRGPRPRIYLSSGIHGDEPAPPLALVEMLEAGVFDDRANWLLCPLLNPNGFIRGTRENAEGIDLNRDYKDIRSPEVRAHINWLRRQPNFSLAICLHEDWESTGFYLYELNPDNEWSFAEDMIIAAAHVCPIDSASIIDGRESHAPGIIRPIADPLLRENWPEAIYLRAHHTRLTYTLESPSALRLEQRIASLRAAIDVALAR
jgi:protein MpaA